MLCTLRMVIIVECTEYHVIHPNKLKYGVLSSDLPFIMFNKSLCTRSLSW